MAGIKIDITASGKEFAKQIREYTQETKKLNAEQKRSTQTTTNLAKEELALSASMAKASNQARKLADQEKRLGLTEKNTALATERLRQAQVRTANSAERLRRQSKKLTEAQKNTNNTFRGGVTNVQAFGTAIAGLATGAVVKGLFDIGSELETVTIKFETLLGSTTKAKERLEEIEQFSQKTPFQFPDVAKASALLETFGGATLATGKGLELVGDATAITGQKIVELSSDFGRLYEGLQSGGEIGDPLRRFQDLGLVTGKLRRELEALNKEGRGQEAWAILERSLDKRVGGAMERLSQSATGLTSTLKDQLFATVRKSLDKSGAWNLLIFGLKNATGGMDDLIEKTDTADDTFKSVRETLSGLIVILTGVWETFKLVGTVVTELVMVQFNSLIVGVTAIGSIFEKILNKDLKGAFSEAKKGYKDLADVQVDSFNTIVDSSKEWFDKLREGENLYNNLQEASKKANQEIERTPIVGKEESTGIGTKKAKGFQGSNPFTVDLLEFAEDDLDIDFDAEKEKQSMLASIREEALKSSLDGEITLLQEQSNEKLLIAQDDANLMLAIKEDTAKKEFEITKKYKDLEKKQTLQNLSVAQNALGAGFATAKLFAGKNQKLAISEALLNGALGITKTFATYGATPAGFAGSALIGANTALQVQEISRQKFADGGLVRGAGTGRSDSIDASLSNGEFVTNERATAQNLPMLQRMNNSNSHTVNVTFQPSISIQSSDSNTGSIEEQLRSSSDTLVSIIKDEQHRGSFD